MNIENLSTLKIHHLTEDQYRRELKNDNIDENAIYITPSVGPADIPSGDTEPEMGNYWLDTSEGDEPINVGGGMTASIFVTGPDEGSTVTATKDGKTIKGKWNDEDSRFEITGIAERGMWTVMATNGEETEAQDVLVDGSFDFEVVLFPVFGISRDITNPSSAWTRTDNAVDFSAIASAGTVAGSSDFDSVMPWSGIKRETLSTGDVMVKIPKFYFKRYREGNVEHIKIASTKRKGFTLHPLFNHGGVESECAYVGAYKTSSNNKSVTGAAPQVSQTRATMRSNAKNKGTGWGLIDIAALSAIQMLSLVEFATNNVQDVIGRGYCDNNSASLNSGSCDSVPNLTGRPSGTDGKTGVVYRGIENFWGNVNEFVDGINVNNGDYFVCNDISKYADDTTANYEKLSFSADTTWVSAYITEEGLDSNSNAHVMLPSKAAGGDADTYVCDLCSTASGLRIFVHGGQWAGGSACGLFASNFNDGSTYSGPRVGSRLLYIPAE